MEFIFATGNPGKVREVQEICDVLGTKYGIDVKVLPMPEKLDIPETGESYRENSLQKASFVWDRYHCNCFADDSGLEVDALDGAPGIYTARFCGRDFASGINKLLHLLDEKGARSPQQRRAAFKCCITLIVDGKVFAFDGNCPGTISDKICGDGGFGFDPVFIADATPLLCMAQLPENEKNMISHRGLAMEKMFQWLSREYIEK